MARKRSRIVWFDEAARRFNLRPDTLREWIAEGRFPAPRGDGNQLFYTQAELDDLVEHGFLGRWKPQEKSRKEPTKGRKDRDLDDSAGEAG